MFVSSLSSRLSLPRDQDVAALRAAQAWPGRLSPQAVTDVLTERLCLVFPAVCAAF